MTLIEEIRALGIEISNSSEDLQANSHDASLFEIRPTAIVFPKNATEIGKLVKFVSEKKLAGENISLTARSAGSDMTGGPLTTSLVVNFTKYFNHVIEVGNDFAVAQPGVYYRDFEKETMKKNLLLPSYPASREICAIGGIVNNNSGGEKTLTYGKTERYVRNIKMVLADGKEYSFGPMTKNELDVKRREQSFEGKVYKDIYSLIDLNYDLLQRAKPDVTKNSSGYYLWNVYNRETGIFDMSKLFTGAQGTLGMMTEVKLGLVQPKKYSRLLVVFLKDLKLVPQIASKILRFQPESFESYDDHTFKLALKFLPAMAKQMKGNMITLGLSFFPEFLMVLSGGIPKLVLMAEFTADTEQEAQTQATEAQAALESNKVKTRVITTEREMKKYWTVRRESFNLLRNHVHGMHTAPFIDDFAVRTEKLGEFLPKLYELLNHYKITYTIAGHVGDGNFHIIPLMDFRKPETKEIIKKLSEEVYTLVFSYGGTMSGEHNDGLIRTPFLEKMYGKEVCDLFQKTKDIFDPLNIFNPGKKVNGSLPFAIDHLVKE